MKKLELILKQVQAAENVQKNHKLHIEELHKQYENNLEVEKSRFDSLLRDKIKQGKQLKRAKKGIDYWKNKCALVSIDRDAIASEASDLKAHNKSLLIELETTRKELYRPEESGQEVFQNKYGHYVRNSVNGRSCSICALANRDNDGRFLSCIYSHIPSDTASSCRAEIGAGYYIDNIGTEHE